MYTYHFSYSRVAILLSILNEEIDENLSILIPDYICESVPNYLNRNNINLINYKIKKNLRIDWDDLNQKLNYKCKFLVIVNYFGFPLDLNQAIEFADKNNLILIEDSTHCHGGIFEGKYLGTFGKYSVTSPRKHIPLKYGGILNSYKKLNIQNFKRIYLSSYKDKLNFFITKNLLKQKLFLKRMIYKSPDKIIDFFEPRVKVSLIDKFSLDQIKYTNWVLLKSKKAENFNFFKSFCKKNGLNNLIDHQVNDLNPWALPVLLNSEREVLKWINWGVKNKVIIFSWPTLSSTIDKKSSARDLSKRLVCFSTYTRL